MVKTRLWSFDWLFYILVYAFAVAAFVVTLYPFLYVVSMSLSSAHAGYRGAVFLWPVEVTVSGYSQVLAQSGLWTAYGNTIYYTVVGTLFNIVATSIAAYPLSRKEFFARKFFNFFIAFTLFFNGGIIPSYLLLTNLGFYNSRWVMIIPGLLSAYNVMVCRSAYSAIPDELVESAKIDGANDLRIFASVAVRLITPTLAVLTLYYAVAHWNEYFTALLFFSKQALMPMQVLLRRVLIQMSTEFNPTTLIPDEKAKVALQIRYVTIVVATLPILAIYPLVQRYFVKGVMLGAVKG